MVKQILIIILLLWNCGFALADVRAHKQAPPIKMGKQQIRMSLTNKLWRSCKNNIERGNFEAAGASLWRLQKALSNLERFDPRRNLSMIEDFRQQTRSFSDNLVKLGEAIQAKDGEAAHNLSVTVDDDCRECHKTFR
jgi:cytochrome c556